jgi:predicted transposase/invertase (TIGR01784 family)
MNLHDRDIKVMAFMDGKKEGLAEGEQKKAIETAKKMLEKGIAVEVVAECTGLAIEDVEKLVEK